MPRLPSEQQARRRNGGLRPSQRNALARVVEEGDESDYEGDGQSVRTLATDEDREVEEADFLVLGCRRRVRELCFSVSVCRFGKIFAHGRRSADNSNMNSAARSRPSSR